MANINSHTGYFPSAKTRPALLASFLFIIFLLAGCSKEEPRESLALTGETMGTSYHITLVADAGKPLGLDQAGMQAALYSELETINYHMSTYSPDSELMRLNAAPAGEWFAISLPLEEVLELSQSISAASSGAFDITVGPLVNLWGFGADKSEDRVPAEADIDAAKAVVGYQKLEVGKKGALKQGDIKLDLSAIAKGYGVDWIARFIAAKGISNYMVEIGGEVRVAGVNAEGKPWRIAIEQPSELQQGVHKVVSLSDVGMATSGDYRNYFEQDGKRYSHTIDPVTGYPINHALASVTVIAKTAAEADGWATAINVLGPDKGMEVANREKLAVYMIVKEKDGFSGRYSTAFETYQ